MAATRLIALHINKGKTVAQCLADRTDYSQNAAKTEYQKKEQYLRMAYKLTIRLQNQNMLEHT